MSATSRSQELREAPTQPSAASPTFRARAQAPAHSAAASGASGASGAGALPTGASVDTRVRKLMSFLDDVEQKADYDASSLLASVALSCVRARCLLGGGGAR
jgi:hypothetical protein